MSGWERPIGNETALASESLTSAEERTPQSCRGPPCLPPPYPLCKVGPSLVRDGGDGDNDRHRPIRQDKTAAPRRRPSYKAEQADTSIGTAEMARGADASPHGCVRDAATPRLPACNSLVCCVGVDASPSRRTRLSIRRCLSRRPARWCHASGGPHAHIMERSLSLTRDRKSVV